jgi:copper transport protein
MHSPCRPFSPAVLTGPSAQGAELVTPLLLLVSAVLAPGGPSPAGGPSAPGDLLHVGWFDPGLRLASSPLHTELLESRPGDGASPAPHEVREILLRFSTPVQLHLSRIRVVDDQGRELAIGSVAHPAEDEHRLFVTLATPLPSGEYTVEWRAGAPDNHIISGTFTFRVEVHDPSHGISPDTALPREGADATPLGPGPAPGAVPPDAPVSAPSLLPAGTGIRWLHLLGLILFLGVTAFRFGVVRPLLGRGEMAATLEALEPRLRRLAWLAALLMVAALPLRLLDQVGTEGSDLAVALLFRSAWGAGWFLQLAVASMALVGLVLLRGTENRSRGWNILAGAALLLPLVPALSGHAWGAEGRGAAVPFLYLHVAGAGIWLGGLLVLLTAGLPSVGRAEARTAPPGETLLPPLARLVNGFSRVALVAVATLVISGSVSSFLQLGGVGALFTTAYGRTLALKLGLVAGALLLGSYNWRKVRPSLNVRPDPGELRIPASVEALLGLLVLLATAVLVSMPPP